MKRVILISFFLALLCSTAWATDYYIDDNGSDSNDGLSTGAPFKTFTYAQDSSRFWCGDTLYLMDGTYNSDEGGITVEMSCTSGDEAVFEAQNYSMESAATAIVDGDYIRQPLNIDGKDYIIVKGITFKESSGHVIDLDTATNLTLEQVTAYDSLITASNHHVWNLDEVTNSTIIDCAGWGTGRNSMLVYKSSNNVIRRFWAGFEDEKSASGGGACLQLYNGGQNIVENFICTHYGTYKGDDGSDNTSDDRILNGLQIWSNSLAGVNDNQVYGSVVYNLDGDGHAMEGRSNNSAISTNQYQLAGNGYTDFVSIGNEMSFRYGRGDSNATLTNVTFVDASDDGIEVENSSSYNTYVDSLTSNLTLTDSVILNNDPCGYDEVYNAGYTFTHTGNTFYGNSTHFCDDSQHASENNTNPSFDTTTYGNGAYLIRSSALGGTIGAEVLYRYENGSLTSTSLWPWPMEDRIFDESTISPTYSADQGSGETGGIWKTLEGVYGTYGHSPEDDATGVSVDAVMSWTNPGGTVTVDVLFEACDGTLNTTVVNDSLVTEYDPGTLDVDEEYCWRVDVNYVGSTDTGIEYSFTTAGGPPAPPANKASIKTPSTGTAADTLYKSGGMDIK